ncbi:MAG TPA: pseudouridine synthase [Saprospiraceae bacterium]|nr:pseudouridine synthase [Saprospiraceae bacterium]
MRKIKQKSASKGDFSKFINKEKKKSDVIFEKTEKSFPKKIKSIVDKELSKIKVEEKPIQQKKPDIKPKIEVPKVDIKVEEEVTLNEPLKLNKFLAHAGLFSRRTAATIVKEGKVYVNNIKTDNPAYTVQPEDVVTFDGKIIKPESKKVYILMNKPKNTITTLSDEKGRKTVTEIIQPKYTQRIYPVGRLDRNTTGLLLLTNDGDLTTKLSHPSNKVKKIYLATLNQNIREEELEKIKEGLILEDGKAEVDEIVYNNGKKDEVIITIHIGKNRIVRRIFEHLGLEVVKLDRIYYAGLTKKDLPRGFFRDLTKEEVNMLLHFAVKK